jgi:hypothetical protein
MAEEIRQARDKIGSLPILDVDSELTAFASATIEFYGRLIAVCDDVARLTEETAEFNRVVNSAICREKFGRFASRAQNSRDDTLKSRRR